MIRILIRESRNQSQENIVVVIAEADQA